MVPDGWSRWGDSGPMQGLGGDEDGETPAHGIGDGAVGGDEGGLEGLGMGPGREFARAGEVQGLTARRADEEGGDAVGKGERGIGVHGDDRDAGDQ